ncbi:MAG: alpha/beta hydrolase [Pseudomonadota bacterium]|nr:alpha/beta hydrolase [Pseudomonadota bacterium]
MGDGPVFELRHCLMGVDEVRGMVDGRRHRSGGRVMDIKAQVVADFVSSIRQPGVFPPLDELRQQIRTMVDLLDEPAPALPRIEDISVPGAAGDIPARAYWPVADGSPLPVLMFIHGGGWVQGDLHSHHGLCARLAAWSGALVVALDYRLAPETKFPGAVEDCVAAYAWLRAHAGRLDGDPARVAVGGDSAGGNLSAVTCLQARDAGIAVPDFQLLIYPATDFAMDTASHAEFEHGAVIPRDRVIFYRNHYLNSPADAADPLASPLKAPSLEGLPPALVQTAGFDPLRDEGLAYAGRLREAGVDVVLHEYPGQIHGFMMLAKAIPEGLDATREAADYMRRAWKLGT